MAVGPTTTPATVTHALQMDPRSSQSRSIVASCRAPGCTWSIRGALDIDGAQAAFIRAHPDDLELRPMPVAG